MISNIKYGLNVYTLKLVVLFLVTAFFEFMVSFGTAVSIYAFPKVYNFYIAEAIVFGILSLGPTVLIVNIIKSILTGNVTFLWKIYTNSPDYTKYSAYNPKFFAVGYLITVSIILLVIFYEYLFGFL